MTTQRDPAVDCAGCLILVAVLCLGCIVGGLFVWMVMR